MRDQDMAKAGLDVVGYGLKSVARAITVDEAKGNDEAGVGVGCLTEAVMGVTAGLCRIAAAIESLAEAVRESGEEVP